MRKAAPLIVAILVAACASPAPSPSQGVATSSPAPTASLPAALAGLVELDALVSAETVIEAGWPLQWATVMDGSLWLPNFEGAPPSVGRLDTDSLALQETVDLRSEVDQFPPDATGIYGSGEGVWVTLAGQDAVGLIDPATNKVVRRITIEGDAYGLAVDGRDLWITDFENNVVLRVNAKTGKELARIDASGPYEVAVGDDAVWVSEKDSGNLMRIDPDTNAVVDRIGIGGSPGVLVAAGSVWARGRDSKVIKRIDPATNEIVATIDLPSNVFDVEYAGGKIWGAVGPLRGDCSDSAYLVRIDPGTNALDGWIAAPCAFAMATDGRHIWATQDPGGILTVDAK